MSIGKLITSASLAFAMIGGAIAVSPVSVEAAGKICPQQVGHPCHDKGKSKRKPMPPRFGTCKPRIGIACLH